MFEVNKENILKWIDEKKPLRNVFGEMVILVNLDDNTDTNYCVSGDVYDTEGDVREHNYDVNLRFWGSDNKSDYSNVVGFWENGIDKNIIGNSSVLRPEIEEAVNNHFPTENAILSDECIELVCLIASAEKESADYVVDECVRVDTKTKKLITSGWIIGEGDAYFSNDNDALEWFNKEMDTAYDNIAEACGHEDMDENFLYHTDWYEFP